MNTFCDYLGSAGKCGVWTPQGTRCKRHEGKESKTPRQKIGHYSGASEMRQKEGYKTSGRG